MQVILLYSLGVSEESDTIRSDAWLFSALRTLKAHVQARAAADAQDKMNRGR